MFSLAGVALRPSRLGSLIPFGCSLRAAWLVHAMQEKTTRAAREVGHARTWSLNQQLKARLGVTLHDCRDRLPGSFDWDGLRAACGTFEARTNGREEIRA